MVKHLSGHSGTGRFPITFQSDYSNLLMIDFESELSSITASKLFQVYPPMALKPLDCIYMDRGDNVQCTISRFGACVISWVVYGVEQLFASRQTIYDNLKVLEAGIMLVFPEYKYWSIGPVNGFTNMMVWKILEEPHQLPSRDVQVVLQLLPGVVADNIWNYKYNIIYTITLLERELHLNFKITNLSPFSFYFRFLFSNHIRVPDIRNCQIRGLETSKLIDKSKDIYLREYEADTLKIHRECMKVFCETKDQLQVSGVMSEKSLHLSKNNLPDMIIRSDWKKKAKLSEDFMVDEWNKMLIVEIGHQHVPIVLQPQENFECGLNLLVKPDKEEDDFTIRFY